PTGYQLMPGKNCHLSVPKTSSLCIFRSLEPSVRTLTPLKWRSVLTVKPNVINRLLKTRSTMEERQGAEREVQCLLKIGILARDRTFSTGLPGNRASLTAAARAGEYFARVTIASTSFQQFDNSISIPPLTILGPSAVTLDPGQKVRFRTNYDDAKTDIVTWSVVSGGGSFDAAHVYTAASAPGNSTIRAAYSPQQK